MLQSKLFCLIKAGNFDATHVLTPSLPNQYVPELEIWEGEFYYFWKEALELHPADPVPLNGDRVCAEARVKL